MTAPTRKLLPALFPAWAGLFLLKPTWGHSGFRPVLHVDAELNVGIRSNAIGLMFPVRKEPPRKSVILDMNPSLNPFQLIIGFLVVGLQACTTTPSR
ncbi:unnamed protein product [Gordionus sp. m RMFG-2023]